MTFGDDAGSPQIKVRTAQLLTALDADKQDEFDRRFRIFTERFAAVVKAAEKRAKSRKPAPSAYAPAELRQLVFGAYTGLSRLGVASEAGIRESAIGRLVAAARAGTVPLEAAYAVLVPALSDSAQGVRALAFESLKALGMTPERLATEALGSGQHDVGGMGLDVLARAGGSTGGASVLEDVLRSNNDGLEFEAARLLASFRSGVRAGDGVSLSDADQKALAAAWIGVHTVALDARSESMRSAAVKGLGGAYEAGGQGPAAKALRSALASKYRLVRFAAAEILAQKGDAAAFDVLCEMLASDQAREQTTAIQCLQRLGDPRAPGRFLDRVDNDRSGTARVVDLLRAAGSLRTVADAERLFGFLAEPKTQSPAFDALLTLSGYDQRIEDPSDEGKGPPGWEQRQHPRRDALLARMIDALRTLGDEKLLPRLFAGATWARGKEVDAALAPLVTHAKAELRNPALQALSWRLRRRGADPALVLPALQSGDPVTQFIAAEGLALAGRADGMSVLLAGVDMMPDLGQRRQAVVALGTLADVRALDLLLRLANEEGHALQEQAAEALGHMREAASDRADRVFEVLARLATGSAPGWMKTESLAALLERMAGNAGRNSGVARQALTGLRHYGGRDAWAIIRAAARNANWAVRERAADLLKHNDAPETRELLADVIRSERQYKAIAAAGLSLRHLFGEDSLEPDYVFAESPSVFTLQADIVDRLRSRGDPRRILDLLPKVKNQALLTPLITILTSLSPLPLEAALEGLQSPQELTVAVAARILGTAGPAVAASHGGALVSATEKWAKAWNDEMALLTGAAAGESVDESDEDDDDEYNDDDDDDDYNDDDDDDDEYNDDDDDEYDDDSSDDGDHVANFGVGTGKLAALTAPYVRLLWALGRVGVGEPLLVAATTAGGDDRRGREVRREAVLAIAGGHGELSKLARQNLGVLVRGGDAELRSIAASTLVARDPKAASKLVGELLDDGVSLARLVDGEAAKAAQPALREAATQAASQGLALRYLVELGDVAGLAKILEQKGLGETLRLGVLEALANIASDDAIARLKAFGADEKEDEELRKAARRAVRRARRRQQAAHKAPRRSRWEVQP
ncbi:MAG: HEAT repeat domain-containing protein [Nannocystaceae bacterium]